jgi:predicted Zn-dependent protease
VVERDPANLEAQLVFARGLAARVDSARASTVTKTLVEHFPQSGTAHTQVGEVALGRGDRAGARAAFEKALALDPDLLEPLRRLERIDLAERQPGRPRTRVEARLERTPNDSAALVLAGQTWVWTQAPRWTAEKRPFVDGANPAISAGDRDE